MSTTDGVNWFREALPIEIKVISGSVVLGSDATPMVLVGDFMRVEGVLSISDVSLFFLVSLTGRSPSPFATGTNYRWR